MKPMHRLLCFLGLLALLCAPAVCGQSLEDLSATEFLQRIREPLRTDAWAEFTGRINHVRKGQPRLKGTLRVRATLTAEAFFAQLVLNDSNVYGLEQLHETAGKAELRLDLPASEQKPGLFDFGLEPADLSFAFIYWDLVKEMPRQSSRWRTCRVMRLAAPKGGELVDVWFDATHGFPMEAEWFRAGEDKPYRRLVMQGAKRHANGLWFVKEMRLDGDDWKTQVKFDFAEKNVLGAPEKN